MERDRCVVDRSLAPPRASPIPGQPHTPKHPYVGGTSQWGGQSVLRARSPLKRGASNASCVGVGVTQGHKGGGQSQLIPLALSAPCWHQEECCAQTGCTAGPWEFCLSEGCKLGLLGSKVEAPGKCLATRGGSAIGTGLPSRTCPSPPLPLFALGLNRCLGG